MINPWKTLSVHRKSTDEEIRDSFIRRVKKTHPDKKGGDREKFLTVNEAYQLIRTKETRNALLKRLFDSDSCVRCSGLGVHYRSRGLTEKIYTACPTCGGAGLIISQKEKEDVAIELHGTDSAGRKRRNNKRRS